MNGLEMVLLLILSCWTMTGAAAEALPKTHYRQKHGSLCLQAGEKPPFIYITWSFKRDVFVNTEIVIPAYKNRVENNPGNGSLCIKNLRDDDNGLYTVSILDAKNIASSETHKLIVEDAVATPVIRMSYNTSAGSCSITVNCTVQGEWAWSVCDYVGCRTSQRSPGKVINITVSGGNGSIVCSGNNHASKSSASESIEGMCFNSSNPEPEGKQQIIFLIAGVTAGVCVFCVLIGSLICAATRRASRHNNQQAETPSAQVNQPAAEHQLPRLSSTSSEAVVEYENVEEASAAKPVARDEKQVETVYSVLQRPRAPPDSSQ